MSEQRMDGGEARDRIPQDGLGRDAAHGQGPDALSGGSVGRSTSGRSDDAASPEIPRGTDESSGDGGHRTAGRDDRVVDPSGDDRDDRSGDDAVDPDALPRTGRRDPSR